MQYQQPPAPPQHYPHTPGMPPAATQHLYGPPRRPRPHPQPFPMPVQHPPVPYPHPHPMPGGSVWTPPPFAPPTLRSGLDGKRLPLYLGGAATVIAAVAVITGFVAPGIFVTKQLDINAVQAGVSHVLSDPTGYGARNVSDVTCNDGHNPTVTKGGTFTCQATIDHIKHQFIVTFTDDGGSYEISAPKGTKV